MGFVLHAMRPEELFADSGTDVGSFTILASGAVGANVVSVEPVPQTREKPRTDIRYNDLADGIDT